jgi:hypothetical protein
MRAPRRENFTIESPTPEVSRLMRKAEGTRIVIYTSCRLSTSSRLAKSVCCSSQSIAPQRGAHQPDRSLLSRCSICEIRRAISYDRCRSFPHVMEVLS